MSSLCICSYSLILKNILIEHTAYFNMHFILYQLLFLYAFVLYSLLKLPSIVLYIWFIYLLLLSLNLLVYITFSSLYSIFFFLLHLMTEGSMPTSWFAHTEINIPKSPPGFNIFNWLYNNRCVVLRFLKLARLQHFQRSFASVGKFIFRFPQNHLKLKWILKCMAVDWWRLSYCAVFYYVLFHFALQTLSSLQAGPGWQNTGDTYVCRQMLWQWFQWACSQCSYVWRRKGVIDCFCVFWMCV